MSQQTTQPPTVRRLAIEVRGVVQGVGFRPFVYNAARAGGLTGWVRNEADLVQIEVQGTQTQLDAFLETLRHRHPPQARINAFRVTEAVCQERQTAGFEIRHGAGRAAPRPTIPADLATCEQCLEEIRTDTQRRYRYPFTNCTNCGPRWSIIEQLPYDRSRTSMARFAMCPDCRAEYEDPADRRFHAQPIACPRCGPVLRLLDGRGAELAVGDDALGRTAEALRAGRVAAIKGLGGFQLLVDATSAAAVARLRQRKRRPDRPLAVMMSSLQAVRRVCQLSAEETRTLLSHQAPIVLLRRRGDRGPDMQTDGPAMQVVEGVAPDNPYLGIMLPYTPLHHLLMTAVDRPLVCTSGNLSEEPMAIATADALARLGPIADVLLTHNRPIVRPVDDSLVRHGPEGQQVLRRARGYAPLPIALGFPAPTILAAGGHLKSTVALCLGSRSRGVREKHLRDEVEKHQHDRTSRTAENPQGTAPAGPHPVPVILSPHIGDLDSVLSVEVHRRAIRDLVGFFQVVPDVVACDLHPDYASTRYAEDLAAEWKAPLVRVQHHHAHVAACIAEHRLQGPVLGLAWDGTGYGPDGTVWGGEGLICEGADFTRTAHLRTFPLPGGDRAVRQPRRSALGMLFEMMAGRAAEAMAAAGLVCDADHDGAAGRAGEAGGGNAEGRETAGRAGAFARSEIEALLSILTRAVRTPRTSSMGRLFDAVAALCGLPAVISFEGQAAMALEFAADRAEDEAYTLPLSDDTPAVADWEPLVRAVLADRSVGVPVGRISARFHNALAKLAVAVARRSGCSQVALSGGCFQNALLSDRVRAQLLAAGFTVYTHHQVPPGDGGIALGQTYVAAKKTGEFSPCVSASPVN
ncbi:MAG: carbamoyltransferase HypF [Pirellulales bacterium]|nr:carbamoyltransferase HypF [Pirellulales bacterium]